MRQFLRPRTNLSFERDRGLEKREGISLAVHRAFNAVHKDCVDFAELFYSAEKLGL